MNLLKLIIIALFLVSCFNDDDFNSRQDSIPKDDIDVALVACADAVYGRYQDSQYVLPYPVGTSYQVDLNHCSASYHGEGRPDQFAVDFNMPIDTEITAARNGTVVFVEESGTNGSFPNNKVIVQHSDNTYAQYMHLTNMGAAVNVGDVVVKGQLIGYSGVTGLAGYPHLHFVVTAQGWKYPYVSIPYNFSNTKANPKGPVMGETYTAQPY